MLKLMFQYFGHLMWRTDLLEKTLITGKVEGVRRRGRQRMRGLDGIIDSTDCSLSKFQAIVQDKEAWCIAVHWVAKRWTQLSNWTTATIYFPGILQRTTLELVAISPPGDCVLSELFTMARLSGWPCMVWLTAFLSYSSPFAMMRLWPMEMQCNNLNYSLTHYTSFTLITLSGDVFYKFVL